MPGYSRRRRFAVAAAAAAMLAFALEPALAFGDKGHEVIALVARARLSARAVAEVDRLLQGDRDGLVMRDGGRTSDSFERQATWADYFRDAQRAPGVGAANIHSSSWHFVDIDIRGGTLARACFGFPPLAPGTPASDGADPDCVVDKIEQFAAELGSPSTSDDEKRLALKYLLHLVGDVHQPLHASDDGDRGGNRKHASVDGAAAVPLHRHWDVTFVECIAVGPGRPDPTARQIAAALARASAHEITEWQGRPDARRWAFESFALSRRHVYGSLPAPRGARGEGDVYALSPAYVEQATRETARQLSKAGFRLAAILNQAFAAARPR